MNISAQKLATNDAVMYTELDGEAVLLNIETGVYFGLDSVGTQIWQLLADGNDQDEIVGRLLDQYEVDRTRLHDDLMVFFAELQRRGLIVAVDA